MVTCSQRLGLLLAERLLRFVGAAAGPFHTSQFLRTTGVMKAMLKSDALKRQIFFKSGA